MVVARCSLLVARCLVVCCVWFAVGWVLCVATCCVVYVDRYLLFDV